MIKFFIKTYGCQANVADSQAIINFLSDIDCKQIGNESGADLIIVNTCAIRDKAEQKVYSYIGELAELKKQNSNLKIIIVGCIASYRKKEFYSRFPSVDFVIGAKDNKQELQNKLFDIVSNLQTTKQLYNQDLDTKTSKKTIASFLRNRNINLNLGGAKLESKHLKQSFINITTGCNNFCSYCIVPFVRGREKSFSSDLILEKVKKDLDKGVKEITLLGQNVNSYRDPENNLNFAELLDKIAQIKGDFWVRFVSSHPKDMNIDLIDVIAKYKDKLCGFIHHPLQSGSNKILKAMNRKYTVEQYLEQIGWIKNKLPQATISTDIIVGFPGEFEADYLDTRNILEQVRFNNVFSFVFSSRKFTKASLLKDNCFNDIKIERLNALQKRQAEISRELNDLYIGKTLKCLVEKHVTNDKLLARTAGNIRVLFDADDSIINSFVNLKIEKAGAVNLEACLAKDN